ncbi:uncharacterized protein LOC107429357 isoform X1 [Ziziphus jujuba]|uniref:Uncharacterized protein LOC107429357 isoform X1 n=1 Tax=Ziziphus jujuba TaxID=326968 RepID=A0ABM3I2C2_ZIZJJ|nr:uncharacterized protein LOC107429357 isoform X1 [Ziziphus jujuba]XP_048319165.2 uncharacterized protein LOC107429357 isoform X1 [Ziziphus jujuba]XP_048319166.2 uncharacterized protein LOC107429357 isoform X1 [Ziziphus jujuba]
MSGQAEEEGPLAKASKAADDLYQLRDTCFPANPDEKIDKLQKESDLAIKLLDSIPPEQRKFPVERATYEYLRGKILDVFSDYKKEAEDHLSKAVKLNPSLTDAWLCLGNCIWKKGDLSAAKNCFALALSKGPNKKILCQLSMLERKMAQGTENQAELVEESIQHAKEAITLDVKDGNSWYNLGNACLTSFFVTGAWDHSKLLQSLKAYQNAEKDDGMKSNPDLYFNCATVNKYLENYERALTGFEAAGLKDPGLKATEEVQKIVNLLDKLDNLLRGHARSKRLASLASSLASVNLSSSYRRATIDDLSDGLNKGAAVVGKVLFFIRHENVAPLYYLLCDSNEKCFALSVYGLRYDAIKEGDQIILLEPFYRQIEFSWKEKFYHFKSVRVDFIEQLLVNGKAFSPQQGVRASIYAQHKP